MYISNSDTKPLRGGNRSKEHKHGSDGHVLGKASHLVHCRGMKLRVYVSGAEEEQRLKQRVVYGMQQGTTETTHADERAAGSVTYGCDAGAYEYHAHILDTRVCQHTFDVVLHGCEDDAPEACDDAREKNDKTYGIQQLDVLVDRLQQTHNAVYARLNHHARHYGRHVRRCCGVSLRKPDVHGEETRLHAEADEEDDKERQGLCYLEVVDDGGEVCRARNVICHHEACDEEHKAYVHHHKVVKCRTAYILTLGLEEYQQE